MNNGTFSGFETQFWYWDSPLQNCEDYYPEEIDYSNPNYKPEDLERITQDFLNQKLDTKQNPVII